MAADLPSWTVQGIHEWSSDVEVSVRASTPVGGRLDDGQWTVRLEPATSSAFLLPEQARHLASVLMQAADVAERKGDSTP